MWFLYFSKSFWILLGSRGSRGTFQDPFEEQDGKRDEKVTPLTTPPPPLGRTFGSLFATETERRRQLRVLCRDRRGTKRRSVATFVPRGLFDRLGDL